jgi:hypothetical protein
MDRRTSTREKKTVKRFTPPGGVSKKIKKTSKIVIEKIKEFVGPRNLTLDEVGELVRQHPEMENYEGNCDHLKPPKFITTRDEQSSSNLGEVIFYNDPEKGQAFYNKFFGKDTPLEKLSFYYFDNPEIEPSPDNIPSISNFKDNGHDISVDKKILSDKKKYSVLITPYNNLKFKIKIAGSYYDDYRKKTFPYFYIENGLGDFVRINDNCEPEFKLKKWFGTIFNHDDIPQQISSFGKRKKKIDLKQINKDIKFLKLR